MPLRHKYKRYIERKENLQEIRSKVTMTVFSTFLNCFMPSSQVSDEAVGSATASIKVPYSTVSKKSKSKSSSSEAPILVSYFPQNSYLSRL
ncbi:hypothetical protein DVH24_016188 [Malus domestica]|uniref:Uncharacterized protein n=1 Tax=Malus domestica TaxID=3750 RepID=A0A498JLC5_MALDO|nr:hypothetical protein DVH24_016188 [Malus domestica]